MLDIKFIRENTELVKKAIIDKRITLNLDELLDLDNRRRSLLAQTETLQAAKNSASKEIPKLSDSEKKVRILEMQEIDSKHTELKQQLREIDHEYQNLLLLVPNIPSKETPIGPDDSGNVAWSYWSPTTGHIDPNKEQSKISEVPTKFSFEIKDHIALGKDLDLIDTDRGVITSGFRGYYLKNQAVLLQQALINFALKKLEQKGFTLMATPVLVKEFALVGSGHFPAGREEIYRIANSEQSMQDDLKESLYLAGTSEAALLAYYADTILEEADLPVKVSGLSSCYRSEIGSYGKDTRGIYRIHEFQKVEQLILCKADLAESDKWLEALREVAEEILQELKLPYRVLNICTGDMGAAKYKMYDIETWMPSRQAYGETHSDSSFTDWQSRRLNIRYRDNEGNIKFVYTLNNTAVASPRILIPLLENYQQADGSILIPDVLKPFLGFDVIKSKTSKVEKPAPTSKEVGVEAPKPEEVAKANPPTGGEESPKLETTPEPKEEAK